LVIAAIQKNSANKTVRWQIWQKNTGVLKTIADFGMY
jgi:hypothetical protein